MKWTKPEIHDLSDLKNAVAQGACSEGVLHQAACLDGGVADPNCDAGGGVGEEPADCSGGSAVS